MKSRLAELDREKRTQRWRASGKVRSARATEAKEYELTTIRRGVSPTTG